MLIFLAFGLSVAFPSLADSCPDVKPSLRINNGEMLELVQAANNPTSARKIEFKTDIPGFLRQHVGDGPDQISEVVLQRARTHFFEKRNARKAKNVCYAAMDATRPHLLNEKEADKGAAMVLGNRLYLICESLGIFKALPVSHGGGIDLKKQNGPDLKNGRHCAKYFGNIDSTYLTMGGRYMTDIMKYFYKGKVRQKDGGYCDYSRPFLTFTGEGETANAKERAIGAHPVLKMGQGSEHCDITNPHADAQGYVYFADKLINYNGGRTEGCLGMPEEDAALILTVAKDHPMSVYVYPQKADIENMSDPESKPYWNKECLAEIGTPKYYGDGESESKEIKEALRLKAAQAKTKIAVQKKRPNCPGLTDLTDELNPGAIEEPHGGDDAVINDIGQPKQ